MTKNLGKVLITFGGVHDSTKSYKRLVRVTNADGVYLSKLDVPTDTLIADEIYWLKEHSFNGDSTKRFKVADAIENNDAVTLKQITIILQKKLFYVSTNGDDTNKGNFDAPLRTMKEAISRIPYSGAVDIQLLTDYIENDDIDISGKNIRIKLSSKTFSISTKDANGQGIGLRTWSNYIGSCSISFIGGKIVLPAINGGGWFYDKYRAFIHLTYPDFATSGCVAISNCTIEKGSSTILASGGIGVHSGYPRGYSSIQKINNSATGYGLLSYLIDKGE